MKKYAKMLAVLVCVCFIPAAVLAFVATPAMAADEVVVIGTVAPEGKLIGEDTTIYVIADDPSSDVGKNLMEMIDKKVQVKGTVMENEGIKTITVIEFVEA